jgi:hypothetical protein
VLAALVRAGYRPLIPFGDGHPYDIALDDAGKLTRVQCKTGRLLKQGVVFFPTASWCRNMSYRSYHGDVDYFGVYCADTDAVYLVPIGDVPDTGAYLRVDPTKNGQSRGVRWACDYIIWPTPAKPPCGSYSVPLAPVSSTPPSDTGSGSMPTLCSSSRHFPRRRDSTDQ